MSAFVRAQPGLRASVMTTSVSVVWPVLVTAIVKVTVPPVVTVCVAGSLVTEMLGCVGAVLTAELFNSALETLFHGLDAATKQRLTGVLDISAGAVLLASATAAAVGSLVLGYRLWMFLGF